MSDAVIIDGKAFAADIRAEVGRKAALVKESHGLVPGLSVVLVGDDPASHVYVRNKGKATVAKLAKTLGDVASADAGIE